MFRRHPWKIAKKNEWAGQPLLPGGRDKRLPFSKEQQAKKKNLRSVNGDHSVVRDDPTIHHTITHYSLNLLNNLKAPHSAKLALNVSIKPGQASKLHAAVPVMAMVHFHLVRTRF